MILTLRPHHILCRLGFCGYGYSPEFITEMQRIIKAVNTHRAQTIIARIDFDNICRACPHIEYECSVEKRGPRGNAAEDFDRRTLRTLKLKSGHPYPIPEIDERIARLSPEEFTGICLGCEWQVLGECARAHLRLREKYRIK